MSTAPAPLLHPGTDPRLMEAALALNSERLDVAERLLKSYLKDDPFEVRAIRMLAELAARIGRMGDSETLLRRAIEISPGFTPARANLALVLARTGRAAEALPLLEQVFEAEPDDIGHFNLKAATLGRLGDFDEAIALYENVLARVPNQPRVWLSLGHMLKTVGQQVDGIAAYRRAIELRPQLGEAWWSLANLKTVRFTDSDRGTMEQMLETAELTPEDRFHLHFALGKAFHDERDAVRAFRHYVEGNRLRRERLPYDPATISKAVDRAIEVFTPELFARAAGLGFLAADPIFIVGMPRAGSTLVEQILSSHSRVEGTSELPDLPAIAREQPGYPGCVRQMDAEALAAAGREYLKRAGVQRRTDRPFFIDKLPNNWLYVPFIALVLPNAKIIDARRHPLGCGFANFRQHFAQGQPFSYDLADMGSYYADYVRLMGHVDAVLPGRVHRVIYESMVSDTEAEVRRLLESCGLPFEQACLEFYKTERAVRTASSEQVRQPIYRGGTEEWRAYEAWLQPLKQALGATLDAYPAAPEQR
ncbi:sulfotransferase [Sphingomonas sp. KRR8]|uniref:tetratricopeptide repeat-containing sulfotransferase family protein n=1 Tax=Sphingomonas sp. KRR8 TaxID=2942996 RepID=UPI00202195BA|nr:sulfotransferase [Sphingomonas sp. KRR8]URD61728.1 sulfotransferase [Sphingomonas sp. KRR8]